MSSDDIAVRLTGVEKNVVDNNFGVSLADFFLPGHAQSSDNPNYPTGRSPWDLISDLGPTVLRYPGGSSSKFRHPFGSMNYETWNVEAGKKNGGYGICLEEIIRFYDRTNGIAGEAELLITSILADMNETGAGEPELDGEIGWIASREIESFNDFYNEWLNQPKYYDIYDDIFDEELYINDYLIQESITQKNVGLQSGILITTMII